MAVDGSVPFAYLNAHSDDHAEPAAVVAALKDLPPPEAGDLAPV